MIASFNFPGPGVFRKAYHIIMRLELLHKLTDVASYVFAELTDEHSDRELGKSFWLYLRSKLLDDTTKRVSVSEFVYEQILDMDDKAFETKYGVKLSNIKKSKDQLLFVSEVVTKMFKYSRNFQVIDW